MKERLQQLLSKEQLTPVRFAELVGVQRSSVSHILSGRNNPSLDFIQKILLKFPQISSDWLINGIGEIYRDHSTNRQVKTAGLFDQSNEEAPAPYPSIPEPESNETTTSESTTSQLNEPTKSQSTNNVGSPLEIERIVVFYRNRTFREYKPDENLAGI